MASSLNSLGLGSQGVLNFDVIDQLREVDDNAQVKPLEQKIELNTLRKSELSMLTTYVASLKSMTSNLSSETTYLKRSASISGSSVEISAASGTTVQDFNIDVNNLAMRDIYESNAFALETSTFASGTDTLSFEINGETYDIDVDSSTTISQLKDQIFDASNGDITASILNVGGDNPYRLVVKSTDTGADNAVTISSTGNAAFKLGLNNTEYTADTPTGAYAGAGDNITFTINGGDYALAVADGDDITQVAQNINDTLSNVLSAEVVDGRLVLTSGDSAMAIAATDGADAVFGLDNTTTTTPNQLQVASDADFTFNGVNITRASNSFDDLVVGVNMTLKESGSSSVSITQDSSDVTSSIESFVTNYNQLLSDINEKIKYDVDTGDTGVFQGQSQVTSLKAAINRQLLDVDSQGRSLADYGLELNSSGILEFNQDTFNEKTSSSSGMSDLESFFRGSTTIFETTITGSSVSTGAIDVTSGDLTINDTEIVVSLNGTPSQNAEALKDAINSANISGISAQLNTDGTSISLVSNAGLNIAVGGTSGILSNLGLNVGTTVGNSETVDGYFTKFNSVLADYITGDESILNLFDQQLTTKGESLSEERLKTIDSLDKRYAILVNKFAAYDSIIAKLNSGFQSLSLMIEQSVTDS